MSQAIKKVFNLPVLLTLVTAGFVATCITVLALYLFVVPKLPSVDSLKDVQFQVPLKVFTRDEKLIAEFGEKKRAPMNIDEVPLLMKHAVLAAEDDRFYEHPGVDIRGLLRAVVYLVKTGEKGQGGSTITMQVARNFFLSREKTYLRKLNEILLSLKIERELSKDEILELYLNKIYLGNRSYGFAAAAQVYYGKRLEELSAAQAAMLAGLPKAPSTYNPIVNPKRALLRRNYVLNRMLDLGFIEQPDYDVAKATIDDSEMHGLRVEVSAPYVAEMVRSELINVFGQDTYTQGYKVYTTIESHLQEAANDSLRKALLDYDRRHGFRGPESHVDLSQTEPSDETAFRAVLAEFREVNNQWPAVVLEVKDKEVTAYQASHGRIFIDWEGMKWAAPWIADGREPGAAPKTASDIVKVGDVVRVTRNSKNEWELSQIPNVEGAIVSLSSHDGALLALVGGFDFNKSSFNRVIQAERQPGSNIKPFNYSAALEKGYTAASIINDAPIVFDDPGLESTWRPENYSGKVFGPTRLREALIHSRNLVSIRLLRAIGISYAIDYLKRFGFNAEKLPRDLSLSLGSAGITPMEIVTAYSVFSNGGYKVDPYFIHRIDNEDDIPIMRANPKVVCAECELQGEGDTVADENKLQLTENQEPSAENAPPVLEGDMQAEIPQPDYSDALLVPVQHTHDVNGMAVDPEGGFLTQTPARVAKRVISPQNVYIMTSILRDIVKRGTGRRAMVLGRNDLAGKTGTTNDQRDAWFSGFNAEIATTAWVGFDSPHPLGDRETGGRAALPMWIDYMRVALKGMPEKPQERPPGIVSVRIDPKTGLVVGAGFPDAQFEIFTENNVPESLSDDAGSSDPTGSTPSGTGATEIPEQLF